MKLFEKVSKVLKVIHQADFGRINRSNYLLSLIALIAGTEITLRYFEKHNWLHFLAKYPWYDLSLDILSTVVLLFLFFKIYTLTVRRLHDINLGKSILFFCLIPPVWPFMIYLLFFKPANQIENIFGKMPSKKLQLWQNILLFNHGVGAGGICERCGRYRIEQTNTCFNCGKNFDLLLGDNATRQSNFVEKNFWHLFDQVKYCQNCYQVIPKISNYCHFCQYQYSNWKRSYGTRIIGMLALVAWIFFAMITQPGTTTSQIDTEKASSPNILADSQTNIASKLSSDKIANMVVRIECPIVDTRVQIGSGTILDGGGIVLSNRHVVSNAFGKKINENQICNIYHTSKEGQIVGPFEGQILSNSLKEEELDLVLLKVKNPDFLQYAKKYNFHTLSNCFNHTPLLGDKIRIYGFPSPFGSKILTVTSGEINNISSSNIISTFAPIESGNSGGLAVDEKGCMVGIPTWKSDESNYRYSLLQGVQILEKYFQKVKDQIKIGIYLN